MQKLYILNTPKIKLPRQFEAVKHDVKKYLKRERRKILPEGVSFWDFDCKFGKTVEDAKGIHLSDMVKSIDEAEAQKLESFYVEILVKPGHRTKMPNKAGDVTPDGAPRL